MNKAIQINSMDNVATVMNSVSPEQEVEVVDKDGVIKIRLKAKDAINFGHKIALKNIRKGELVYKYGFVIGKALIDINRGQHVHIHNIESQKGRGDLVRKCI